MTFRFMTTSFWLARRTRVQRKLTTLLRSLSKAGRSYKDHRKSHEHSSEPTRRATAERLKAVVCRNQRQDYDTTKLRAHNSEQLISQLPNELLYQIFTKGSLPPDASTYPALVNKYCNTKRYIAQVCLRWREIALDCPDMWCDAVDLSAGGRWVEEILKRSRDRPINVYIPQGTKKRHIDLVLHAHRVRALYADTQDRYLAKKILCVVRQLQDLEELNLVHPHSIRSKGAVSQEKLTPKLRRLWLTGPSIPFPLHPLLALTCLYVTHSWYSRTPLQWLTAIRNFPFLRELSLINCIDVSDNPSTGIESETYALLPQPPPIALSHLRELELRGNHSACGSVFRGLLIPSSCVLRLTTQDASLGPTLDDIVTFLKSDQPPTSYPAPSTRQLSVNRSLFLKISRTRLYLQVSEEQIVKLCIHLAYVDCYRRQIGDAGLAMERLLSATYARFRNQGGFTTFTLSLSDLANNPRELDAWSYVFMKCVPLLKDTRNIRLQGTSPKHKLLNFLESREIGPQKKEDNEAAQAES